MATYDAFGTPVVDGSPAAQTADIVAPPQTATASPSTTSGIFSGALSAFMAITDPSGARLAAAKLLPGGASSAVAQGASNPTMNINTAGTSAKANDWRVSVTMADPNLFNMAKGGPNTLMRVLSDTGGVVFPYIPAISVMENARYTETALTHSNYKSYFYEGSDTAPITIMGEFTVQNQAEGQYLLASIWFFRSVTKMFFGGAANTGNPPPMVKLNGYGKFYFPNVNCVVTSFTHTMGADVDYMEVPVTMPAGNAMNTNPSTTRPGENTVRLPTLSQISVTLQPVYSRGNVTKNFDLTKFSAGGLITNGFI